MKRMSQIIGVDKETRSNDQDMSSSSVRYTKLRENDSFTDIQFAAPPTKVPWKAIILASILFLLGAFLILIAALLLSGVIDAKYHDRTWPVMILGFVLFVPGFYHVRIAYYAFTGQQGYSFDDIPDFD